MRKGYQHKDQEDGPMSKQKCTCCGKLCTFRYPYRQRSKLCARCLRVFVIDQMVRDAKIMPVRLGIFKIRRRKH